MEQSRKKTTAIDQLKDSVLQELKENPYHKFNIAFSLMAIIPFLAFFYVLINVSSLDVLAGQTGGILFICIVISLCGFAIGYFVINSILKRLVLYASRLKHSDQLKSMLIASVAHELKNPITIIKTNLDLISDGLVGQINEEQRKVVDVCSRVTGRMTRLINDLLDLHKIEAGMVGMDREQCNLSSLLEMQVGEFKTLMGKRDIKLVTEMLDPNLVLWGDSGKIMQVINNLLSNAIKHTPDGEAITIRAFPQDRFVRLEVADKGPGIPPDKLEKVFDKFERLDSSKEGTGLGLTIARDIVELHKGRVWAESVPGKGSTFVVVLPRDLRRVIRSR